MKILIVEDARDQRLLLSSVLKKKGYPVLEAENGLQALTLLHNHPDISVVVSDWMMPEMDGIQLCKAIRQTNFGRYLYFILLTGKTENSSLIEGINAGSDDFVSKPVNMDELDARIKAGFRIVNLERVLEDKKKALSDALATIEADLVSAEQGLFNLIPPPTTMASVSFDWFFKPCQHLGGDMLGYQQLDDDRLFFYQLDVAGHGIPSALFSFTLHYVLSEMGINGVDRTNPSEVLENLNQRFQTTPEQTLYFTIAYGVMNQKTGDVALAQAGHPSPLWLRQATHSVEMVESRSVPIGVVANTLYPSVHIKLNPGDRLFLYSDGLTECTNSQDEMLDSRRLCGLLASFPQWGTQPLVRQVRQSIHQWQGNGRFNDDVTYLILGWDPELF